MAKIYQAHKIARETGALVDWQYYRHCRNDVPSLALNYPGKSTKSFMKVFTFIYVHA